MPDAGVARAASVCTESRLSVGSEVPTVIGRTDARPEIDGAKLAGAGYVLPRHAGGTYYRSLK